MKALLIHPLYGEIMTKKPEDFVSEFPLGLAYVASTLRQKGHEVEVLDINRHRMTRDQVAQAIRARKGKVDVIGIGALTLRYNYVRGLAEFIKGEMDVPIILGGPLPTFNADLVLENTKVDICVLGDGELTAPDLLDKLDRLEECPGIAFRKNGEIVHTPRRALNWRLDSLPYPSYDLFDMEHYTKCRIFGDDFVKPSVRNIRGINMMTSLGCPYWCEFCSTAGRDRGLKYRLRSPENLAQEIVYLKNKYGIQSVDFNDDLLVVSKRRMTELCKALKPLNVLWCGQARAEQVDYDILKMMREAGCVSVGIGVETGSQKILKAMNKQTTVADIENAINSARELRLGLKIQLIFGYPGENHETIRETIEMFQRLHHPARSFNVLTPIPGSPLYNQLLAEGKLREEKEYIERLSAPEWGFRYGKPMINLTEFSDEEFLWVREWAEEEMSRNYHRYLWSHPRAFVRYYYRQWKYADHYSLGKALWRAKRKFNYVVLRRQPPVRPKSEKREEQAKLFRDYQF